MFNCIWNLLSVHFRLCLHVYLISFQLISTFYYTLFFFFLASCEPETQHACVWCPSEAGGGNDSVPAALHSSVCVCSITYSSCVCVLVLMVHLDPVGRYKPPALSLARSLSPPAVTVGHDTHSHTHVIWCGFSWISLHVLFALKTELPTAHTLHFLSHFIALLSSALFEGCWNVIW